MSERKPTNLIMFRNGLWACCDQHGQQIGELQVSSYEIWAERAESLGYDPEGCTLKVDEFTFRITKTEDGWRAV